MRKRGYHPRSPIGRSEHVVIILDLLLAGLNTWLSSKISYYYSFKNIFHYKYLYNRTNTIHQGSIYTIEQLPYTREVYLYNRTNTIHQGSIYTIEQIPYTREAFILITNTIHQGSIYTIDQIPYTREAFIQYNKYHTPGKHLYNRTNTIHQGSIYTIEQIPYTREAFIQ